MNATEPQTKTLIGQFRSNAELCVRNERESFEQFMKTRGTPLVTEHPQAFDAWNGRAEVARNIELALMRLVSAVECSEENRGEMAELNVAMHEANCALTHNLA